MAISEQTVGTSAIESGWDFERTVIPDNVTGSGRLQVGQAVTTLRVYNRYLRTSEAIGNYHADKNGLPSQSQKSIE